MGWEPGPDEMLDALKAGEYDGTVASINEYRQRREQEMRDNPERLNAKRAKKTQP